MRRALLGSPALLLAGAGVLGFGASSAGATGTTTASKLVFTTEPPASPPQTANFTVSVSVENSSGEVLTTNTSAVTLELTSSGSASAHLECTGATSATTSKASSAATGVATFTCKVDATGSYKLHATDASLTAATSTTVNVVAAPTTASGTTTTITTATVYGQTPDATAAAEFARAFPSTKSSCPTSRDAVLATTKEYQDALSSQFLAEDLTTGTLLTPTTGLASVTATTLKKEGIATVYVVGGPLAVTTTVVTAIEASTAYECGGTTRGTTTGKIAVHRISGETQYATAMSVAEFVGTAGSKSFAGAYATTNATGGTGRYNDTAAKGSAAPSGAQPTAILASGEEFQDAQSASVVSYHTKLPLVLTPATTLSTTAVAAIEKLGVKQVILMGGPLAVSNTVEAALVAKTGVSVLRVAGKDYTDTARELARFEVAGSTAGLGWTPGHRVMVARGNGFTDGLCGAVLENVHSTTTGASGTARPLLLTESPTLIGTYLATFLKVTGHTGIDKTATKTVTSLTVLGGPLAVSTAEITAMETDLKS
ncbi:MAG TPA: cell wall-binding repeat-containing protein [Acidimicrobiales bacterium]|nr:cell wall-binding repeat-containing protein [Acidimicrobiales bacterium]